MVPSLEDNPQGQAHSRLPECDGQPSVQIKASPINRMVTVQTDLSKWFTPHGDLFATPLNHKIPLYISPVPDQHAWDIDALNIVWSGLTAYAYLPTTLLHRVIQNQATSLPHFNSHRLARDALVLGPSAALNRDPTQITSVSDTSQTVPQPNVSQQSTDSHPSRPVSRTFQLQEQGFSVEGAERIAGNAPTSHASLSVECSQYIYQFFS